MAIAVQKETTSDILMSDYVDTGSIDVHHLRQREDRLLLHAAQERRSGRGCGGLHRGDRLSGFRPRHVCQIAFQDESEPEQFGVAMGLDNVALQTAINEAIAQLTEEGFFEEITEYWFGAGE